MAFRHFETEGMEYLIESIHGQRDRMQDTRARTARRQGDIDSLAGELLRLLGIQDGVTSGFQGIFNPLLDDIDGGTGSRTLFSAQLAQAFQLLGQQAALAEITGLGQFQILYRVACRKVALR